jgi:hypothetical protein
VILAGTGIDAALDRDLANLAGRQPDDGRLATRTPGRRINTAVAINPDNASMCLTVVTLIALLRIDL